MSDHRTVSEFWRKNRSHALSVDQAEEIDRRGDRFEAAWRRGEAPRLEDHLGGDGPFRAALMAELVAIELEWRRRVGAVPSGKPGDSLTQPDGPRDTWPPTRVPGGGVLETLSVGMGSVPHVLLRDTDGGPEPPLHRPNKTAEPDAGTRYRIDGEIARGGMGSVLKGRDPDLGRDVALKVLREDFRDNVEMVRRFVEEAQIGGQLQHPGIVPIYEMGTFADRRPFFSMKLVKGDTLAKLLAARKDPGDGRPRFLSIFEAIAQTVAYSHARGVIHRDLKPSNVMVGSFGEVQVMDWGLAKVLPRGGVVDDAEAGKVPKEETVIATARSGSADSELSMAGSVLGTPSYMAPEQARGEIDQIDERADVFALGSILCEILTGHPAFLGRGAGEILRKAALGDLADATTRLDASGANADLIALAKDCLAREPEDRPSSASLVSDRVTAHLAGVQERLRRAELESVEERARRRLTMVAAASLILLGLVGGGGYTWNQSQKAERLAKTARGVDDALADAARLRGEAQSAAPGDAGRWSAALSAAKRAEGLLAQGDADATLAGRVGALMAGLEREQAASFETARQIEVDQVLLAGLESARGGLVDHRDPRRTDAEYAEVFRKAGLDLDAAGPDEAGRWLASRTEPVEMAGYLDDWAFTRRRLGRPEPDWRRLVDAARRGDPDPWRDAIRTRFAASDPGSVAEFRRMADDPKLEDQPAPGLLLLARQLKFGCDDRDLAAKVLRRAARRHSGDFRIHYELALAPGKDDGVSEHGFPLPEEAVRHLTTALGIRPASATTHHLLAAAYLSYRKRAEAEAECREAIRLRPGDHVARSKLCEILRWSWKFEEAEAEGREAVRLRPSYAPAHSRLGKTLRDLWKLDDAATELRETMRLNPDNAWNYPELAEILQMKGDYAGAAAVLREGRDRGLQYTISFFYPADWYAKADAWVALGARLPAVVRGEDRPRNQDERLDLAKMARQRGFFATSARLEADAMAEDPKIAEDRKRQGRYDAACHASQAAAGHSRENPPPDQAERGRLRALALRWLRGELEAWIRYMESGTPQVRMTVASTLTHWRLDGDLTAVRDPEAQAKLPEDERRDWQALWADVEALLARAEGKVP